MRRVWAVFGISIALGAGLPQEGIRIPAFGPYYAKKYEEGIRKWDPIALMELDQETLGGCVHFDPQSEEAIEQKVRNLAEHGNGYAMYLMAKTVTSIRKYGSSLNRVGSASSGRQGWDHG